MTENQETRAIAKDKEQAKTRLLSTLKNIPQAFKAGIGAAEFVKEFKNIFEKYITLSDEEIFALEEISLIIKDYPHIVKPGAEDFFEDLLKASVTLKE